MRTGGGLYRVVGDSDEKRADSAHVLKIEPAGFPDRVGVRGEWKEPRIGPGSLVRAIGRMGLPSNGEDFRRGTLSGRPGARL